MKHKGRKSRMNFFIMHLALAGKISPIFAEIKVSRHLSRVSNDFEFEKIHLRGRN